jgi:hypothetical protein
MSGQKENIVGMRKKLDAQAEHTRKLEQRIHDLRARLAKYEDSEGLPLRAVVLPEPMRRGDEGGSGEYGAAMIRGYNACLREVARLNSSPVSLNQCDGCRAGIPLENGMHAMGIPGGYADKMMCTASHYESAPSHGEQVRAGWQWVPVDPTPEMLAAVTTSKHEALRAEVMRMAATDYRLMLAAAPSAVSQEQGE